MKYKKIGSTLLRSTGNWVKLNLFLFIGVYLFEVLLKLIFVIACFSSNEVLSVGAESIIFGYGIDFAVSAAITIVLTMLLSFHQWVNINKILFVVISILFILQIWVLIADINFFHFWRWRLQSQAFDYLKDFSIVLKTLPPEIWMYVLVLLIVSAGLVYVISINWKSKIQLIIERFPSLKIYNPIKWLIWGLLFVIVRGGVGPAVHSWGDVMKSPRIEISVASMNGLWNFGYVLFSTEKGNQMKQLLVSEELEKFACEQYLGNTAPVTDLKKYWLKDESKSPQFCFVILLEGINAQWFEKNRLPLQLINKWKSSMVYFNHCYAVGDRTDKGLAAVLTGWPGEPGKGILHEPTRWSHLNGLPQFLLNQGWNTNFVYGGDGTFANMNGFMNHIGIESIFDQSNIRINSNSLKWGYSDMAIQKWLSDVYLPDLKTIQLTNVKNQFTTWMQLASHEPFDVADSRKNMLEKYKQSIRHSDSAVTDFLTSLKNIGIWDESLVVILSDHGRDLGLEMSNDPAEFFRIPLFIGGGVINRNVLTEMSSQNCSQTDIYATLSLLLDNSQEVSLNRFDFFSYPWNRGILPQKDARFIVSFNGERSILLGKNQFCEGVVESNKMPINRVDSIRLGIQSKIIRTFFRF